MSVAGFILSLPQFLFWPGSASDLDEYDSPMICTWLSYRQESAFSTARNRFSLLPRLEAIRAAFPPESDSRPVSKPFTCRTHRQPETFPCSSRHSEGHWSFALPVPIGPGAASLFL